MKWSSTVWRTISSTGMVRQNNIQKSMNCGFIHQDGLEEDCWSSTRFYIFWLAPLCRPWSEDFQLYLSALLSSPASPLWWFYFLPLWWFLFFRFGSFFVFTIHDVALNDLLEESVFVVGLFGRKIVFYVEGRHLLCGWWWWCVKNAFDCWRRLKISINHLPAFCVPNGEIRCELNILSWFGLWLISRDLLPESPGDYKSQPHLHHHLSSAACTSLRTIDHSPWDWWWWCARTTSGCWRTWWGRRPGWSALLARRPSWSGWRSSAWTWS